MRRTPVVQIVHVSDLHVTAGGSDKAQLAGEQRWLRLRLREWIEAGNWGEWHEGTLAHDETAEEAFGEALAELAEADPEWPGDQDGGGRAPTWLVDTGDLTTYGDVASLQRGQALIEQWRKRLRAGALRSLYGNHDAWPGTLPLLAGGPWPQRGEIQLTQLREWAEWLSERWRAPLSVQVPGADAHVELYGLDSVCFGPLDNTRAVGRLSRELLKKLEKEIERRQQLGGRRYRILATHHPLAYPFQRAQTSVAHMPWLRTMHLEHAGEAIRFLKNERAAVSALAPSIHLILSGHTHAAHPARRLPATVKDVYQETLGPTQMQLVAGPLMLVSDRERVRAGAAPRATAPGSGDFAQPEVLDWNQQFEVLRFYFQRGATSEQLLLKRFLVVRSPNEPSYMVWPEGSHSADGNDAISVLAWPR